MTFTNKLKDVRKNLGFTQEKFSEILGCSRSTYAEIETGRRNPNLKFIVMLSEKTNTKRSYWIDGAEVNVNTFDYLRTIYNLLCESGLVTEEQTMPSDPVALKSLFAALEIETKNLYKEYKEKSAN